MWNSLLDNAKKVAEKAKEAAETIEGQLNESVGTPQEQSLSLSKHNGIQASDSNDGTIDQDDCFDSAFDDDEEEEEEDKSEKDVILSSFATGNSQSLSDDKVNDTAPEQQSELSEIEELRDCNSEKSEDFEKENVCSQNEVTGAKSIPYISPSEENNIDCVDDDSLSAINADVNGWDDDININGEESNDEVDSDGVDTEGMGDDTPVETLQDSDVGPTSNQTEMKQNHIESILIGNRQHVCIEEEGEAQSKEVDNVPKSASLDSQQDQHDSILKLIEGVCLTKSEDKELFVNNQQGNTVVSSENRTSSEVPVDGVTSGLEKNDLDPSKTFPDESCHNRSEDIVDELQNDNVDCNSPGGEVLNVVSEEATYIAEDNITTENHTVVNANAQKLKEEHHLEITMLQAQIESLQVNLTQRESQLKSKSDQISHMLEMHELEKEALKTKVKETKDEAKKRLTKAKERVDDVQARLIESNSRAETADNAKGEQENIIFELRKEGEKLAIKQSEMETRMKEVRTEMRDLQEKLDDEIEQKKTALNQIDELEKDLKSSKEELRGARTVESRADQLDSDLLDAKEEREKNVSAIRSLENELKEAKSNITQMRKDMQSTLNDKETEYKSNCSRIEKERDDLIKDLESKLRNTEREANMREDSLRHEVGELRKRWQESVRRADALSIDLQQSSAPLMQSLSSAERLHRSRAAAWAELETKMRSTIEEQSTSNEKLSKENNVLVSESSRLQRTVREYEDKTTKLTQKMEETKIHTANILRQYEDTKMQLEEERQKQTLKLESMQEENNTSKNKMLQGLRDTEERHNTHLKSLERKLEQEREKRLDLEREMEAMQVNYIASSEGPISTKLTNGDITSKKEKQKELCTKTNQVDILQSTIFGLNDEADDISEDSQSWENTENPGELQDGSFAYLESLTQTLKAVKEERDTLRKQLDESEDERKMQLLDLASSKSAAEKLPQLIAQVETLRNDLTEKDFEIEGLRDDIMEVRKIYRSQIETLICVDENHKGRSSLKHEHRLITEDSKKKGRSVVDEFVTGFDFM